MNTWDEQHEHTDDDLRRAADISTGPTFSATNANEPATGWARPPASGEPSPHRIVDGYCFDCQGGGCILEVAERNARYIHRKAMAPHPWDEWNLEDAAPIASDDPA
jgi:hypothetical protein